MSGGLVDELHEVSLEKENQDLKEILEVALQITNQLETENIVKTTVLSFVSKFQTATAILVLADDLDEASVQIYAFRGTAKEDLSSPLPSLIPVLSFFSKEEYSQVSLASFSELYEDKTLIPQLSRLGTELLVPLRTEKSVIGLLLLPRRGGGQTYGVLEIQYITNVVRFAALAIENASLFRQATTDRMTGLYSHHFFEKNLEEEMERARRYKSTLSLVMFDIDHFKDFNDKYGHLQGDRIIREIAKLLTRLVRQVDFAARYGGEEFAVILPSVDLKGAAVVAERLRKKIEDHPFPSDGEPLHVTISLGITEFDQERDYSPSEIIRAADRALYTSKEQGRNRVSVVSA